MEDEPNPQVSDIVWTQAGRVALDLKAKITGVSAPKGHHAADGGPEECRRFVPERPAWSGSTMGWF